MTNKLSKRDFLKLASLVPASYFLPATFTNAGNDDLPNIIILVFDAWSAKNVSLYGYPRKTTPNLDKLAEKAIVYHNHYAGGYFTIPGPASLFTSTLEWQHQLNLKNNMLASFFEENNIFGKFPEYKRIAYFHNLLANRKNERMASRFPLGLPSFNRSNNLMLEDAVDWLANFVKPESDPYLTYFHLLPPHAPYTTRSDFHRQFRDEGYSPQEKPEHFFSEEIPYTEDQEYQKAYDEFILYVDAEIDRFFSLMETSGKLENTWVILTSDHGEIFERGLKSHRLPSYYGSNRQTTTIDLPSRSNRTDRYPYAYLCG